MCFLRVLPSGFPLPGYSQATLTPATQAASRCVDGMDNTFTPSRICCPRIGRFSRSPLSAAVSLTRFQIPLYLPCFLASVCNSTPSFPPPVPVRRPFPGFISTMGALRLLAALFAALRCLRLAIPCRHPSVRSCASSDALPHRPGLWSAGVPPALPSWRQRDLPGSWATRSTFPPTNARLASGCRLRSIGWDWLPTGWLRQVSDASFTSSSAPRLGLAQSESNNQKRAACDSPGSPRLTPHARAAL